MTQGDPVPLEILKIVVNAVVRAFLTEVCVSQEAQHGFIWAVGEHDIVLYMDDSRIAVCNPIWVQTNLTAMVRMFDKVGL